MREKAQQSREVVGNCEWCGEEQCFAYFPIYHYQGKNWYHLMIVPVCRECWESLSLWERVTANRTISDQSSISKRKVSKERKAHEIAIANGQRELF